MRLRLPNLLLLAAVLVAVGYLAAPRSGSSGGGGSGGGSAPASGVVTRVVDGDTIHVDLGGRDEAVRYIGVDTPESVKPGVPVQCYAEAASRFDEHLVDGRRVRLRFDVEARDRYGRLLAYVWRASDGLFVNAELVRRGYARTLTIPPNVAHAGELAMLARQAREARRGLWRRC